MILRTEAQYTDEALRARINATVDVGGQVGVDGVPRDLRIIRSAGFGLDQAALAACYKWRFAPATKSGHPIAMGFGTTVAFRLPYPGVPTASVNYALPAGAEMPALIEGSLAGLPIPPGVSEVRFVVGKDGRVINTDSTEAAIKGRISTWLFRPALLKGAPVAANSKLILIAGK